MRTNSFGLSATVCFGLLVAMTPADTAPASPLLSGSEAARLQGRGQMADAVRCERLGTPAPVVTVVDGSRPVHIRFPDSDPVAILTVPKGAVRQPTTFMLSAPAETERVLVEIDARDGAGNAVTDFSAIPLGLTMHLRKACTPRRPQSRRSFFIFQINPADSSLTDPRGNWDDASVLRKTPRVSAELDHLSGFIIAQGDELP